MGAGLLHFVVFQALFQQAVDNYSLAQFDIKIVTILFFFL